MDSASLIFFLLATLLVIASLLVVFLRNVVHCAMALVAALLLIAILFVTLQAPMVGVLQVMVYAGAIMVLFLVRHHVSQSDRAGAAARSWWGFGTMLALMFGRRVGAFGDDQGELPADPVAATELFGSPEMLAKSLVH